MRLAALTLALAAVLTAASARAAEPITLTIEHHRFTPDRIAATAGTQVELVVVNLDGTPEEFESRELGVETFIPPKGRIKLRLAPRKPGDYPFLGDFHPSTAKGVLTLSVGR